MEIWSKLAKFRLPKPNLRKIGWWIIVILTIFATFIGPMLSIVLVNPR